MRSLCATVVRSIPGQDQVYIKRIKSESERKLPRHRIILGATGSCASVKIPEIARELIAQGMSVVIIPTHNSLHFFSPKTVEGAMVFTDDDEWNLWQGRGDPVLHIDLHNWATMMVIAPLDANTLGKLANGLADNLLTCVARAWPVGTKPFLFAPSMNTDMWNHPITYRNICQLTSFGYVNIEPIEKELMCGDVGKGAMAHVDTIVRTIESHNSSRCTLL